MFIVHSGHEYILMISKKFPGWKVTFLFREFNQINVELFVPPDIHNFLQCHHVFLSACFSSLEIFYVSVSWREWQLNIHFANFSFISDSIGFWWVHFWNYEIGIHWGSSQSQINQKELHEMTLQDSFFSSSFHQCIDWFPTQPTISFSNYSVHAFFLKIFGLCLFLEAIIFSAQLSKYS